MLEVTQNYVEVLGSLGLSFESTGSILLTGTSPNLPTFPFNSTGYISIHGTNTGNQTKQIITEGSLILTGNSDVSQTKIFEANGSVLLAGNTLTFYDGNFIEFDSSGEVHLHGTTLSDYVLHFVPSGPLITFSETNTYFSVTSETYEVNGNIFITSSVESSYNITFETYESSGDTSCFGDSESEYFVIYEDFISYGTISTYGFTPHSLTVPFNTSGYLSLHGVNVNFTTIFFATEGNTSIYGESSSDYVLFFGSSGTVATFGESPTIYSKNYEVFNPEGAVSIYGFAEYEYFVIYNLFSSEGFVSCYGATYAFPQIKFVNNGYISVYGLAYSSPLIPLTRQTISFVLSGGINNSNPNKSIGGNPSDYLINSDNNNIFNDFADGQTTISHRCFYLFNESSQVIENSMLFANNYDDENYTIYIGVVKRYDIQNIIFENENNQGFIQFEHNEHFENIAFSNMNDLKEQIELWLQDVEDSSNISTHLISSKVIQIRFNNRYKYYSKIKIIEKSVDMGNVSVTKVQDGAPINAIAQVIPFETTTPFNVEFIKTNELLNYGLGLGDVKGDESVAIWLKREVPEDTEEINNRIDGFRFKIKGMVADG